VSNFDKLQWRGLDTHSGSWEVTPPTSLNREVQGTEGDLSWPVLAAQVDDQYGTWGLLPMDTLKVGLTVEVEERSSIGDIVGECSACRSTIT
jgi:hypothetical protein